MSPRGSDTDNKNLGAVLLMANTSSDVWSQQHWPWWRLGCISCQNPQQSRWSKEENGTKEKYRKALSAEAVLIRYRSPTWERTGQWTGVEDISVTLQLWPIPLGHSVWGRTYYTGVGKTVLKAMFFKSLKFISGLTWCCRENHQLSLNK